MVRESVFERVLPAETRRRSQPGGPGEESHRQVRRPRGQKGLEEFQGQRTGQCGESRVSKEEQGRQSDLMKKRPGGHAKASEFILSTTRGHRRPLSFFPGT